MSLENSDNERLELYNRFKDAIEKGDNDSFFDADDLVAIVDQAVDLDDRATQMSAVMRGYRYFPDNEEINIRRAYMYYDMGLNAEAINIIRHDRGPSPLWNLLEMRLDKSRSSEQNKADIDNIINAGGELDDETSIRLVDVANELDLFDHIVSRLPELRKHVGYLPALLYEMAMTAEANGKRPMAISFLEELTELEPFSIDFWCALANEYLNCEQYDKSLSATDFALAIDESNEYALWIKASALSMTGRSAEMLSLLRPFVGNANTSDNPNLASIYAMTLRECDREKGDNYIIELAGKFPLEPRIIDLLMDVEGFDATEQVRHLYHNEILKTSEADTASDWIYAATQHYRDWRWQRAAYMLRIVHEETGLNDEYIPLYYSAMLMAKQYEYIIDLLINVIMAGVAPLTPELCMAALLAAINCRTKEQVYNLFSMVKDALPLNISGLWTVQNAMAAVGFASFIQTFEAEIFKKGPISPELFKIFVPQP